MQEECLEKSFDLKEPQQFHRGDDTIIYKETFTIRVTPEMVLIAGNASGLNQTKSNNMM